jgi:hypothetical protein
MKKIFLYIIASVLILSACNKVDFGDINENPNGAAHPNLAALMTGATMRYATLTGREYLTKPVLYVQYMSQVTYTDEMLYNNAPSTWYGYYIQTLSNYQTIINVASNKDNWDGPIEASGYHANQVGVATIMKCVVFKRVTDEFGDIPYFQALDAKYSVPKYDKQEDIYKDLIKQVKAARDMMDASKPGPVGDPIYHGDVTKWKKFANSFLLSLTLQLSKRFSAVNEYAATEFKKALNDANGVIESTADEAWFSYDPVHNFVNPWSRLRPTDYFLSKEFTDALHGNSGALSLNPTSNTTLDARINIYADNPALDGVPYGYKNGSGKGKASMSSLIWAEKPPLPLMTAAYTYLNRAEAAARGWTSEDAQAMLVNGIKASYASLSSAYGVDITGDADAYANARVADVAAAPGGILQVIAEEKWVALFPKGFQAWSEWRRTDYPKLKPAHDYYNSGVIPRRLPYPAEEPGLNPDGYKSGVADLTPAKDLNSSHFWWDK